MCQIDELEVLLDRLTALLGIDDDSGIDSRVGDNTHHEEHLLEVFHDAVGGLDADQVSSVANNARSEFEDVHVRRVAVVSPEATLGHDYEEFAGIQLRSLNGAKSAEDIPESHSVHERIVALNHRRREVGAIWTNNLLIGSD